MKPVDWLIHASLRGSMVMALMALFGSIISKDKPLAIDSAAWFIVCLIFKELYDRMGRKNNID